MNNYLNKIKNSLFFTLIIYLTSAQALLLNTSINENKITLLSWKEFQLKNKPDQYGYIKKIGELIYSIEKLNNRIDKLSQSQSQSQSQPIHKNYVTNTYLLNNFSFYNTLVNQAWAKGADRFKGFKVPIPPIQIEEKNEISEAQIYVNSPRCKLFDTKTPSELFASDFEDYQQNLPSDLQKDSDNGKFFNLAVNLLSNSSLVTLYELKKKDANPCTLNRPKARQSELLNSEKYFTFNNLEKKLNECVNNPEIFLNNPKSNSYFSLLYKDCPGTEDLSCISEKSLTTDSHSITQYCSKHYKKDSCSNNIDPNTLLKNCRKLKYAFETIKQKQPYELLKVKEKKIELKEVNSNQGKQNNICLFGGWPSTFISINTTHKKCKRPQESFDSKNICNETSQTTTSASAANSPRQHKFKNPFICNDFGILDNQNGSSLNKKDFCIEFDITSITSKCSELFINNLKAKSPTIINQKTYETLVERANTYLKSSSFEGVLNFCSKNHNRSYTSSCLSITSLIKDLNTFPQEDNSKSRTDGNNI